MGLLLPDHSAEAAQIAPNPNPAGNTIISDAPDYTQDNNYFDEFFNRGTLLIKAEFWNHRHKELINDGGTITNEGDLRNGVYIAGYRNDATLKNYDGGTLTNNGTITNTSSGYFHHYDALTNNGTLTNDLRLDNHDGGTFINATSGTLMNYDELHNWAELTNNGWLTNHGDAFLTNNGVLTIRDTLSNLYRSIVTNKTNGTLTNHESVLQQWITDERRLTVEQRLAP